MYGHVSCVSFFNDLTNIVRVRKSQICIVFEKIGSLLKSQITTKLEIAEGVNLNFEIPVMF